MALELSRHKFTADEYEQLGRTGIFTEDDRVELLDGDIVEMSPLGPRHVRSVNRLTMLLAPRLVGHAIVQVQSSLKLDVHWEPQPDVAVLRLREDDYIFELPTDADVLLLIEVVESSCKYDRAKLRAYTEWHSRGLAGGLTGPGTAVTPATGGRGVPPSAGVPDWGLHYTAGVAGALVSCGVYPRLTTTRGWGPV